MVWFILEGVFFGVFFVDLVFIGVVVLNVVVNCSVFEGLFVGVIGGFIVFNVVVLVGVRNCGNGVDDVGFVKLGCFFLGILL